MKTTNLIYLGIALMISTANGQNNDERIAALETQLNQIISKEKARTEAINKVAESVLKIERSRTKTTSGTMPSKAMPKEPLSSGDLPSGDEE